MSVEVTSDPVYRLNLDLPPGWRPLDPRALRTALNEDESSAVDVAWDRADVLLSLEVLDPDLVAVLSVPLTDDDGELVGMISGGLVVTTVSSGDAPDRTDEIFGPRVVDGVELSTDGPSSFLVATYPVLNEGLDVVTLLTFSTPNVSLAVVLTDGFESIARSAHLEVRAD